MEEKESIYPTTFGITIADNGIVITDKEIGSVVVVEDTAGDQKRVKNKLGELLYDEIKHYTEKHMTCKVRIKIKVEEENNG